MAEINVVPYIDVMLVLLVIFMITAPLLTQGVKVNLPKAASQAIDDQEQAPLIVTVNDKGQLFLNINDDPNKSIASNDLAVRVAAELKLAALSHKKRLVLVKGDDGVNYGKVVQVMALLQQAGAQGIGLMTSPNEPANTNLSERLSPRYNNKS